MQRAMEASAGGAKSFGEVGRTQWVCYVAGVLGQVKELRTVRKRQEGHRGGAR